MLCERLWSLEAHALSFRWVGEWLGGSSDANRLDAMPLAQTNEAALVFEFFRRLNSHRP